MNRHDPVVEAMAKKIFMAFHDRPQNIEWVEHGNSSKQDDARYIALRQLNERENYERNQNHAP